MASTSIRDLDDDVKQRLRVRAAQQGRSMEAEARAILADAVRTGGPTPGLFTALLDAAHDLGGVELDLPPRRDQPRHPNFDS